MAECECLPGCPFFNDRMKEKPATANLMKKQYCLGDSISCARHMVFQKLGKEAVPATLYPSQIETAQKLLNQ